MYKKNIIILLLILTISSCGILEDKEIIDNIDKQAIVSEIKVEEKGVGETGNTGKKETNNGFTN